MYRQIDKKRNECALKEEEFAPHTLELMKDVINNEAFADSYFLSPAKSLKLRCFFYNKSLKTMPNIKLEFAQSVQISEVLETVHKQLSVSKYVPLSRCRLVLYDYSRDQLVESLNDLTKRLGEVMKDDVVDLSLVLETREENEEFEIYSKTDKQLKAFKIDREAQKIDGPYYLRITEKDRENINEVIARKFNIDLKRLLVYHTQVNSLRHNSKVYLAETKEDVDDEMKDDFIDFLIPNYTNLLYFYILHTNPNLKISTAPGECLFLSQSFRLNLDRRVIYLKVNVT